MSDSRVDGIFGDVPTDPQVVVVAGLCRQLPAEQLHLVGSLPCPSDHLTNTSHRLRMVKSFSTMNELYINSEAYEYKFRFLVHLEIAFNLVWHAFPVVCPFLCLSICPSLPLRRLVSASVFLGILLLMGTVLLPAFRNHFMRTQIYNTNHLWPGKCGNRKADMGKQFCY